MKLAIMQPYFLPYLGYFQLMAAVDRFVIYDDVSWIKGGWIHRNRMLVAGEPHWFTLPVRGASPNVRICDVRLGDLGPWRRKWLRTLAQEYGKAPHFAETLELVESITAEETDDLSAFLRRGLERVCGALGVSPRIVPTSRAYGNDGLRGAERVLDICRREGADHYVNPIGGRELYEREDFRARGVALSFLASRPIEYAQHGEPFVPNLSILDVLMFNPRERVRELLDAHELV